MNFYEIDFIEAGDIDSGDAIALRYGDGVNIETVHIVDGGHADDGQKLINHIKNYYDKKEFIDHVVLTHSDQDHACGLKSVAQDSNIGTLWMNRPWVHVDNLLPMFEYSYTREGLIERLKNDYPHVAELENIAKEKSIPIKDVFQGTVIGNFIVLAPTLNRYLSLIVNSEKTPEPTTTANNIFQKVKQAIRYIVSIWGAENLKGDTEGTTDENEMSIVQYAQFGEEKIVLTGDAGVEALEEAHQYATKIGIILPGVTRFQVPHHGSRRNLSSEILDKWLGPKLANKPEKHLFSAMISASKNDPDHPRKAVLRALSHRGAGVVTTKGVTKYWFNNTLRPGWGYSELEEYPEDMEE
ncbi:MAG: MBL fold metallo-hydrolase [Candidatus Paceibacterota bacterium]